MHYLDQHFGLFLIQFITDPDGNASSLILMGDASSLILMGDVWLLILIPIGSASSLILVMIADASSMNIDFSQFLPNMTTQFLI